MTFPRATITSDRSLADFGKELVELTDPKGKRFNRLMARQVVPQLERYLDRQIVAVLYPMPPARNAGSPRFIWSNNPLKQAAARRWWWANYSNGYKRTGQLVKQWTGSVYFSGAQLAITVENPAKAASYVFGSAESGYKQVPGHVTTGWYNTQDKPADVVLDAGVHSNELVTDVLVNEMRRL